MIFEQNGAKVYYELHGEGGPWLTLLHGWGGKCESWLPVTRDFSDTHRILVLDFPGHGRSGEPPEPWDVTGYMENLAALMDAIGMERTDIMAHSFGGRVALLLAATHPERVGRMVLTGCAGLRAKGSGKKSLKSRVYRALKALVSLGEKCHILNGDAAREKLIQRFGSEDYKALTPSMRATFNRILAQDLDPILPRVQASTLLIWGEKDTATPLWMGERMRDTIPDAGLVVLPGEDHFAYLHQYERFKTISRQFLG